MADSNALNPHPPEFERFLYASVGEDRNGSVVTVLSTLARLGLDPWIETAELATLGRNAARSRLNTLLERFRDVPALASDHGRVAQDLSQLLPDGNKPGTDKDDAPAASGRPGLIWVMLAIVFVLFQVLFLGGSGSGE
ncbi:hypothetical protein JQU17_00360 [Ponticoccus sp. SC2-23]|uniref:hypothetical protein n=1 Tax=Alexandriicola marinus TaxID=2081710 RepID=UPI000FD93A7A|nr:hypothetical protein [Alexandriicola marinus]MBM1218630.1 hypothetical protein [Ponticoccus sp. SC6-9]MBM1224298.1 hypothetical protein [Ponticoccus sp. SC6-15]MBM1229923.1 hypothetical protein [Ponticoccus sp. SC6-38]MBM1233264.1 hypothetical protein [Ponticoccus sp. SC6-45]MBM1236786.1 hypothetical protein [Ponticoccus sp. SC6-49]MBM1242275.1 hypothetical protein [Ponticoccus sp. SC2-64]MBM1246788.1 hypothetical protein [Ponticoccus sp. SC6-42]MBM1251266.1 hypothetical protein [Pontico